LQLSLIGKKGVKINERFLNFNFDCRSVDFCAGLALTADGRINLSEAGLSGPGQEENT
jgi:hypothetical protein